MVEKAAARAWIDRYRAAWESYDEADIRDLFTENAVYRAHPYESGFVGQDAIIAAWNAVRDDAAGTTFDVLAVHVDGDAAFIRAVSGYPVFGDVWDNLFEVELGEDGRATSFTGWDIKRPAA